MSSIIEEARRNASLPTDIDNFRSKYTDIQYDYKGEITLKVTFPSFSVYAYDKNLFVLLAKSSKMAFIPRWYQRPDYASHDFYNSVIYWPLLLFVNKINSIEDFKNIEYVLKPPFNLIMDMSSDRVPVSDVRSLYEAETPAYNNYYKLHPLDAQELATKEAKASVASVITDLKQRSSPVNIVQEEQWIVSGGSY